MPPKPEDQLPACLTMLRQNRVEEAAEIAAAMARERPHDAQARFAMALVDRQRGATDRALASLERLAAELPKNPLITLEYASTLAMTGRPEEAIPLLEGQIAEDPTRVLPHYWLGQAHLRAFRGREAVECFERVRRLAPQNTMVLHPLAAAYLSTGRPGDAERLLRQALVTQPESPELLGTLAAALEHQNRLPAAGPIFEQLLRVAPGHPHATAGLARLLQSEGKRDQARELLRPVFEREPTPPVVVSTFAGLCGTSEDRRACIAKATQVLADPAITAQDRVGLCFAVARLLEAEGEYPSAFAFYQQGNALTPKPTDADEPVHRTDDLIAACSAAAMASVPRATGPSTRPIFILGFPRSGTSLVEQILAAHPEVFAAGELQELRRIWRELVRTRGRADALAQLTQVDVNAAAERYLSFLDTLDAESPRVTDKMPHNFEQLGLINLLFPDARVIHCARSPLDTCLSCYATQFGPAHSYAADLTALGRSYAQYHRLMAHWRETLDIPVLEVVYEDLVADLDTHARRIVGFVGLPWHDDCLRFYEAERTVTTASVDQVRKPIYTTSIGRWRHYADLLDPLRRALADAGVPINDADA